MDFLRLARIQLRTNLSLRRFKSNFGLHPDVVLDVWQIIQSCAKSERFKTFHLLWALFWLKTYPTEDVGGGFWRVNPKTFMRRVWQVIFVMHQQLDMVCIGANLSMESKNLLTFKKICFDTRFDDFVPTEGPFANCTFCVDVTECQLARPNDKMLEQLYWSGKAKKPTFKYEGTEIAKIGLILKKKLLTLFNSGDSNFFWQNNPSCWRYTQSP